MDSGSRFHLSDKKKKKITKKLKKKTKPASMEQQQQQLYFSVILRPWVLVRPQESNPRPPALQSTRSTDWANTAEDLVKFNTAEDLVKFSNEDLVKSRFCFIYFIVILVGLKKIVRYTGNLVI